MMNNLVYITCLAKYVKMVQYSVQLMDRLAKESVIQWRDVYGGCYNKNKDTLLHLIATVFHHGGDESLKILRLVLNGIIKTRDDKNKDLLFVKNGFGMTFIDCLMICRMQVPYFQRIMDYSRLLCDDYDIKESIIENSIKKGQICSKLCGICSASNYIQLKETLDEIAANGEDVYDYINGIAIVRVVTNCFQICAKSTYGFDRKRELECDNYKCFQLLLSYMNNVDKNEMHYQMSCVMFECIRTNKIECVKLLLNEYCNKYNIKNMEINQEGRHGLMYTMGLPNRHEMVKLLLKHNVFDIGYHDHICGSILRYSAVNYSDTFIKSFQMESDWIEYLDILFEHVNNSNDLKIDPMIGDQNNNTIFAILVTNSKRYHFDVFKYLIEIGVSKAGWDIENILTGGHTQDNETLLHLAVKHGRVRHVKYLLSFDFVDINAIGGVNDDSVLNICISSRFDYHDVTYKSGGNFEVFKLLLKQDAIDPKIKNRFGFDAYDMCVRASKLHYIEYLDQFSDSKR